MNQAAADVAQQAKQPKHKQDDNYCPQHGMIPFRFSLRFDRYYSEGDFFAKLFPQQFMNGRASIFFFGYEETRFWKKAGYLLSGIFS